MTEDAILVTREMALAGMEALRAARIECLDDASTVSEIFLEMYGQTFKEPETWQ